MREESLYYKIYEALRNDIKTGKYQEGDRIPMESELAKQYSVSAITVKKALSMLAEEALILRVPGKGSFITRPSERTSSIERLSPDATPIIGLILEHVSTPFGLEILYTLDQLATEHGYKLCIGFSYGDREKETREIRTLLEFGAKGIIMMPTHGEYYSTDILQLAVTDYPLVLIDKQLKGIPVASVCTDNENATAMLVRHLFATGRRRIGMIGTANCKTSSVEERKNGFYQELSTLGLSPGAECYLEIGDYKSDLQAAISAGIEGYLQDNRARLDAVICSEYGFLPHVIRTADKLGIAIPKDVSVCSIDEDYLAPGGFSFTHVRQDEAAIAKKAMSLMLSMINGKNKSVKRYQIQPIFRKGRST